MSGPMQPDALARQLRRPHGTEAAQVANRMNEANAALNHAAIALLDLRPGNEVLEIGPGNAAFAPDMLAVPGLRYTGLDWSPEMVEAARERHAGTEFSPRTRFVQGASDAMPFDAAGFDRVLCVNTLYFWKRPQRDLAEIARVLRPGGLVCLAFGDAGFMRGLPFTSHGFALHERGQVESWLREAGFVEPHAAIHDETGPGNAGAVVEKRFHLLRCRKA